MTLVPPRRSTQSSTQSSNQSRRTSSRSDRVVTEDALAELTPDDLDRLRTHLESALARVEAGMAAMPGVDPRQCIELHDAIDLGDVAVRAVEYHNFAGHAQSLQHDYRAALRRMDDGTYGRCERCGGAIPRGRLLAFPRATGCVRCATG